MKPIKLLLALMAFISLTSVSTAWGFDRNGVTVRGGVYINPIPITPFGRSYGHHHHHYKPYHRYTPTYGPSISFNYSNGYVSDYSSRYVYRSSPQVIVRSVPETVYIERTVTPTTTYSNYSSYSAPTYYGPSTDSRNDVIDPSTNSGAPLYCHNPDGYYPAVKTCPSGWRRVSQ
jgi:hypothetical protein